MQNFQKLTSLVYMQQYTVEYSQIRLKILQT